MVVTLGRKPGGWNWPAAEVYDERDEFWVTDAIEEGAEVNVEVFGKEEGMLCNDAGSDGV